LAHDITRVPALGDVAVKPVGAAGTMVTSIGIERGETPFDDTAATANT
jgi:hypothetical protein